MKTIFRFILNLTMRYGKLGARMPSYHGAYEAIVPASYRYPNE